VAQILEWPFTVSGPKVSVKLKKETELNEITLTPVDNQVFLVIGAAPDKCLLQNLDHPDCKPTEVDPHFEVYYDRERPSNSGRSRSRPAGSAQIVPPCRSRHRSG
jgi:hypothetical protein